ncbi:class D beta-lactamase [Duganella phyllosphaerae]|uniref:Beta-lactamase OXA-1 n=1 Tax=Duganella phyllosphaerae TaxID=762836 RepID=A0A1E7WKU2_9BURK|nr:class D beta-lactamase [Duganella phyllosphaerae]OEZ99604.1 beta-lactamase OXA-1 precursor [Duganella phyllosphaerae]
MKLSRTIPALLLALGISTAQAVELCTVILDTSSHQVLLQRGECAQQVTSASTFKIAISLMGYDAGYLKDAHHPLLPFREGYVDWRESWRSPTDPTKWMQESVVWYSQQITQSLGMERFAGYVKQFEYGNTDVRGDARNDGLTMSWIGSSLKISPLEQVRFLDRLVNRQLGVSNNAYDATASLVRSNATPGGWTLYGKTGAASGYGWYVGWTSKGQRTLAFARLIRKQASDPQDTPAGVLAREALIAEYPALVESLQHQVNGG